MTNLATFEATINPDGAVNNIVCRFNNETKEYWLAKARCSPWVTSATDNLDHIPDGTSAIMVGMRANAVRVCRCCVVHVLLSMHCTSRSHQRGHTLDAHTRSATLPHTRSATLPHRRLAAPVV